MEFKMNIQTFLFFVAVTITGYLIATTIAKRT